MSREIGTFFLHQKITQRKLSLNSIKNYRIFTYEIKEIKITSKLTIRNEIINIFANKLLFHNYMHA